MLVIWTATVGAGAPASAVGLETACPVHRLARGAQPVEITFWHVQQARNEEILVDQIEQFEEKQDRVRVNLVNMLTYPDIFERYKAALATGDLPDLVQMDEGALQSLVDSRSTVPIQRCVEADEYRLDDFLPQALDAYTTDDVLRAMPWTVSNPVLIYDKNAFRAAGLDPEQPPRTLEEVTDYAQRLVDAGVTRHGVALRAEAFVNEAFYAKSDQLYVNKGNGREGRATRALLDTEVGREIWAWWDDVLASDLGVFTGSQPDNYDNLFALGTDDAAMTIDASSLLGSVFAVLESGQFGDVDLGVGPLPALEAEGGVPVADASLWLMSGSSAKRIAAAWELVKFLSAPEQQASFAVGSRGGYVPIRRSATQDPAIQQLWAESPELKVPFDQLATEDASLAGLGPVTGDYVGVRSAVRDALTAMVSSGVSPRAALRQAQREATAAIQEYNDRLGS